MSLVAYRKHLASGNIPAAIAAHRAHMAGFARKTSRSLPKSMRSPAPKRIRIKDTPITLH